MAYTVANLINHRGEPKTVKKTDKAIDALKLMLELDFSQLPVIDETGRPIGLVSSDSILHALNEFAAKLVDLRVSHVMTQHVFSFNPDDYLSTVQSRLLESYAALVVDDDKKLIGIVTNYDTADYFRRRAKDMMLVEEIETALREHAQAAFDYDFDAIRVGVQRAMRQNNKSFRKIYRSVLSNYLEATRNGEKVDDQVLDSAIAAIPMAPVRRVQVDDLSLNELIGLLLDGGKWPDYCATFGNINKDSFRAVLDRVRKIRNVLAHFKEEISDSDQRFLQWCANLLALHNPPERTLLFEVTGTDGGVLTDKAQVTPIQETPIDTLSPDQARQVITPEDVADPDEGKYGALAVYLRERPPQENSIMLPFSEIEKILGVPLPNSARDMRAWWANDTVGHVQSKQWLDADWRVSSVNMGDERVTFLRMVERERAYIHFYSQLEEDLSKLHGFKTLGLSPNGSNWHTVNAVVNNAGRQCAWFNFSFLRGRRFSVMLYIDSQMADWNKAMFDQLKTDKQSIQEALQQSNEEWALRWDRMDGSRAARITVFTDGAIQDDETRLAELRVWGAKMMVALHTAFAERMKVLARQD